MTTEWCEVKDCDCLVDVQYKGWQLCGHHRTEIRDRKSKLSDFIFESQREKLERHKENK